MKYLLPLLFLLAACLGEQRPFTLTAPDLSAMQHALDATVALVNDEGDPFCAGVAVTGRVLTAAHCVEDEATAGTEVLVAYRTDDVGGIFTQSHPHRVAVYDRVQDIAILRVADNSEPPTEAALSPHAPYAGQTVVTIGHPLGLTYSVIGGMVSHPRRDWEGQTYFQVSSPIFFGNSGGPVYNRYGEVLGLSSFFIAEPHLGGAVHWEVIVRELVPETL